MVTFIQSSYGIDLSQKKQLITGRLSPALRKLGYKSFGEFVNHVLDKKEDSEITLIINKLTTNYTFFMREKEPLDFFRERIIPDLVGKPGQPVGYPDLGNGYLCPGPDRRPKRCIHSAGHHPRRVEAEILYSQPGRYPHSCPGGAE